MAQLVLCKSCKSHLELYQFSEFMIEQDYQLDTQIKQIKQDYQLDTQIKQIEQDYQVDTQIKR